MTTELATPPPFDLVHESGLVVDGVACDVCGRDAVACSEPSRIWLRLEVRETYQPYICTACIMGAANVIGDIIDDQTGPARGVEAPTVVVFRGRVYRLDSVSRPLPGDRRVVGAP